MELNAVQRASLLLMLAVQHDLKELSQEPNDLTGKASMKDWPPDLMEVAEPYWPGSYEGE